MSAGLHRTVSPVVEYVMAAGLALGILLAGRLMWADWQPGILVCALALLVAAACVRFILLLGDVGPGRDIRGMYLRRAVAFGVAINPSLWLAWPRAEYARAEWPRTVTIAWLFFAIQWRYEKCE